MKPFVWIVFLISVGQAAGAQTQAERLAHFNVKKNLALDGYDPVSYFSSEPKEGQEKWSHSYKGITYLFSSQSNYEKFKENPEKYEPAYGGWCAFAMGETGEKVKVDPETFKIVDGKVHLFYNFWGNNTLEDWNQSQSKLKAAADKNWKSKFQ